MIEVDVTDLRVILEGSDVCKESSDYSYISNFMYSDIYKIKKSENMLFVEYEELKTIILPLNKVLSDGDISNLSVYLKNNMDRKNICVLEDFQVKDILKENSLTISEYRDLFDYIYDAESLKYLKGKYYTKKRNHLNYLNLTYGDKIEYRTLKDTDFANCLEMLSRWNSRREDDINFLNELKAIHKIFDNYGDLREDIMIGGVYIDSRLEAFAIGSKLNEDMALIHIEKANSDIRGLYQYINKEFLIKEFPDVKYVNREDDMGLEGLREAKMSYYPSRFIKKYKIEINK